MTVESVSNSNYKWGVFLSQRWQRFSLISGLAFLVGVFAFIYGGLISSYIWTVAPLTGLSFLPLSLLAKTWGWSLAHGLLILLVPIVLALQGI